MAPMHPDGGPGQLTSTKFESMGLTPRVQFVVTKTLGLERATDQQAALIAPALRGLDIVGQAPPDAGLCVCVSARARVRACVRWGGCPEHGIRGPVIVRLIRTRTPPRIVEVWGRAWSNWLASLF